MTSSFFHQREEVYGNDHPLLWSVAMLTLAMFTFSSFSEEEKGLNLTPIWPSFPKEEAHGHGCWVWS